jgi:hypothetical protein
MTTDDRITGGLFLDIVSVLERHGYHEHDPRHTGQAMGVIRDLAHVYEGTRDAPHGTYPGPAQPTGSAADRDAVLLPAAQAGAIVSALGEAARAKRDRAATCADCADQSCRTCQWRLQTAETYLQRADQMTQPAASHAAASPPPEPGRHPQPPTGKEAGQ